MRHLQNRKTRKSVLLSLIVAFVFLFCHTLGASTHNGNLVFQEVLHAVHSVNSSDTAANGGFDGCAVSLTGAKVFPRLCPISVSGTSVAVLFPLPPSSQPVWNLLHAAPTVLAPHRTSLQHQAVLIRI